MPSQGAFYLRDVSGNTALLDTSGRLQINVAGGSLVVTANISGESVVVSSGAISVVSGEVHVMSGVITASVSSGVVSITSGTVGVSGLNIVTAIQSGSSTGYGTLQSGVPGAAAFVYDFSGQVWNPVKTAVSGSNVAIVALGNTPAAGVAQTLAAISTGADGLNPGISLGLRADSLTYAYDATTGFISRVRATSSGDAFRLRVSQEGRAPTYSVNAQNITLFSGTAVQVAPYIALMNFGSGSATPVYKVKGLFIGPDAANALVSGQAIKFDVIRFTAFSGGGTLLSGVAHDTADPAYSGTLAAPVLMKNCGSGVTLDAVYFSYVTSTEGPFNAAASALTGENSIFDPGNVQNTNLIALRMPDTKEVAIRSGYGFGVVQSSGAGYTQLTSGIYSFNMIYSVEG